MKGAMARKIAVIMGLCGLGSLNAASTIDMAALRDKLELTDALVRAAGPIVEIQYKTDPVKLKQVQQILTMISFLPNLMLTMDDLKTIVPTVPKETLTVLESMQTALKRADADFKAASQATQLDDQTQKVLAGLQMLQSGLEGPGNYLADLNEKTFSRMIGLFEGLPTVGEKMVTDYKGKPVKVTQLLKGLFGLLKTTTEKYSVGFKGMEMVINKLIEENAALKAEVARLQSGSTDDMHTLPVVVEQDDAVDLSDLW